MEKNILINFTLIFTQLMFRNLLYKHQTLIHIILFNIPIQDSVVYNIK